MSKNIYVVGKVAFANLVEPKYFMDGSAKYSVRLLIDKFNEKEKQKISSALKEAYENGKEIFKKTAQVVPELKNISSAVKRGETLSNSIYEKYFVLDAKSNTQPQVIDKEKTLLDANIIQSGSEVVLAVNLFPYNVNGNCGISCKLHSLMFVRQGSPIVEESNAAEDFADFDFDSI